MTEAEEAARHWGGTVQRLLGARENEVHAMTLGSAQAALRLHRTAYQTEAAIRAEIDWCAGLSAAGLPVPAPVPTVAGERLVRLASGRHASVTAWVRGVPLGANGVPLAQPVATQIALHHRLGQLLAQVHDWTDRAPPRPFPRPAWDIEGLTGDTPVWGRFWEHPGADAASAAALRDARAFLREQLSARPGLDVGPIHADVVRENVLVDGDHVSLIDFDDCGTGFRLYDLGTAMMQHDYEPARDDLRDALVAGYATLRPADAATVDLMTLARGCASVGWAMPRLAPDNPIHARHIARAVRMAHRIIR
ncbi:MAG: phosphotransferase enzyme family protein [Gemmobacter sp.]